MLFDVITRQLGYTWCPPGQDLVLRDLMEEALAYLVRYDPSITRESAGADHFVRSLVVEYVRYGLSNARDDFYQNYRKELLSLSDRGRVYRAKAKADTDNNL